MARRAAVTTATRPGGDAGGARGPVRGPGRCRGAAGFAARPRGEGRRGARRRQAVASAPRGGLLGAAVVSSLASYRPRSPSPPTRRPRRPRQRASAPRGAQPRSAPLRGSSGRSCGSVRPVSARLQRPDRDRSPAAWLALRWRALLPSPPPCLGHSRLK